MQDEMLSGLRNTGASMFSSFGGEVEPNARDMEEAAQSVLYNKQVKFKAIRVKTFDLSVLNDRRDYTKTLNLIYKGLQAHTHVVWYNDRQFVADPTNPRWVVHMEWAEFELKVTANPTLGSEEIDDEQAGF